MNSYFGHMHLHSNFSKLDGMSPVSELVARAARYEQPIISLTDHGTMSGTVQLYQESKKYGIKTFPGIETYIIDPEFDRSDLDGEEIKKAQRYHLGLLSLNLNGYQGLVKYSTLSHTRPRYQRFPRLLLDDLIEMGQEYGSDIAITTGCVFGLFEKTLIDQGEDAAEGILRTLQTITPNLFVEIQKHDIPESDSEMPEDQLIDAVIRLADKRGLPILATADSHYADQKHKPAHNLMKKMTGGMEEFPGDSFHMASTEWMQEKFSPEVWSRVEDSCKTLYDLNTLEIPHLDTYKPHIPKMADDPDQKLKYICQTKLKEKFDPIPEEYQERLDEELRIIKKVEVADYALLIRDTVIFFQDEKILTESRGSVNGSLVFWLLGATQVDPIKWGTNFERFISEDRVGSSPDVDQDVADSERWKILEYLDNLEINGKKYKTSHVGTYGLYGQRDAEEDTGSAFNSYLSYLRRQYIDKEYDLEKKLAEEEDRKPVKYKAEAAGKKRFNAEIGHKLKTVEDVKEHHPEDYNGLREIIAMDSVYRNAGTHAGGILISGEDVNIEKYIPLMLIPGSKKDTIVSQYTMKDVEQFGLLKLDILGQTSLSVMQKCIEFMGREVSTDFSWIPFDDKATMKYLSNKKNHTGIFHADQFAKSSVLTEMQPKNVEELILWQALSMPGAVDSGAKDVLLERRRRKSKDFGYNHPLLKQVFDSTYGVMVYQEQVLEYCRGIGMEPAEVTNFFKIVKDSGAGAVERNRKRLDQTKPRVRELSSQAGISDNDFEWAWNQMIAMGGYAFNRAHAAGYGIRTYRTAYLKKHYPTEYMAALLYCWAGSNTKMKYYGRQISKEDYYLKEVDKLKIGVLSAAINKSQSNWSVSNGKLRKGYATVKGVGLITAKKIEANQPYTDMEDFCTRSRISGGKAYLDDNKLTGAVQKLADAGVLREFGL